MIPVGINRSASPSTRFCIVSIRSSAFFSSHTPSTMGKSRTERTPTTSTVPSEICTKLSPAKSAENVPSPIGRLTLTLPCIFSDSGVATYSSDKSSARRSKRFWREKSTLGIEILPPVSRTPFWSMTSLFGSLIATSIPPCVKGSVIAPCNSSWASATEPPPGLTRAN